MTLSRVLRAALALASTCVLAVAGPASAQRLPGGVTPVHYDLQFEPDLANATFMGRARIQVTMAQPTSTVVLHAHQLTISGATVAQAGGQQTATVALDAETQQATLRTPQPLAAGEAAIELAFAGTLNDQLAGFYLGRQGDRRYAATQFEATDARRAFPCFDEPALKATFTVTLVVDARDAAMSNTPVVSDTPGPAGKHTIRFETTKRMSTYLVAMVVGDIGCLEDTAAGVPLRICGLGGLHTRGRFAMDATKAFLTYFTDYYGVAYPFGKLDQIGIPDFAAGAMENAGAILYRETLFLIDERTASPDDKREVASIIAHEIAHQWFGNLVTMRWWDEIWLNEGFATWAASKAVARWQPTWDVALSDALEGFYATFSDNVPSSRPIRAAASSTPVEIAQLFDSIAYLKAATVLRMLEQFLGEAAFQQGVRAYLARHAYGNATAADLWTALSAASQQPVERVMSSFVDVPGVPLVTVEARCEQGERVVTLRQRRFVNDAARMAAASPERWTIPVCLRSADGATRCELLAEPTQTVRMTGCSKWTLGNAGRGYYVTAYARDGAAALAAAGKAVSEAEWLRFSVDQFALVQAALQPAADYLQQMEAMGPDHPFEVLQVSWGGLGFMGEQVVPPASKPVYDAWVRRLVRTTSERLGREPTPADTDDDRRLRALVLQRLAYAGDEATRTHLRALADRYLANPASVDAALAPLALNVSARNGDAAFYDRVAAALAKAEAPEVRERLQIALARFRTPALLERTLKRSLTSDVRAQDLLGIVHSALYEPQSRPLFWAFFKAEFPALRAKLGSPGDAALVAVAGYLCDRGLRDDARAFFASNPIAGAEGPLAQSFEQADSCIALREREGSGLAQWLAARPRPR